MTPLVLNDRVSRSEVESTHPECIPHLYRVGAITANSKTIQFSGLIQDKFGNTTVFLPLKAGLNCSEVERFAKAKLLLRVLAKFGSRNDRLGATLDLEGSVSLAHTILALLRDYKRWGIFRDSITRASKTMGKADWKATSNREIPVFPKGGVPYFNVLHTRLVDHDVDNPLSIVHASVIREIQNRHGWWIPSSHKVHHSIRHLEIGDLNREFWLRKLKSFSKDLFASRELGLVRLLTAYLTQMGSERDGGVTIGIRDFHTVWEAMLRDTAIGVELGWNSRLPMPTYIESSGLKVTAPGMLPDIVVKRDTGFLIVDAKYYAADGVLSIPGLGDALKQVCYRMAMSHIVPESCVDTCFVFPAVSGTEGRFNQLKFITRDTGSEAGEFGHIQCLYVSVDHVMQSYSSNLKIDLFK